MMQAQAIRSPLGAFVRSPLGVRQTRVNEGYLYLFGWSNSDSKFWLKKYDASSWSILWQIEMGARGYVLGGLTTDNEGNVYFVDGTFVRKYNKSGTLLWSADHGDNLREVRVDSSLNVYVCGRRSSLTGFESLRKYSENGSLAWSVDTGKLDNFRRTAALCVTVDSSGCVYTGGALRTDNTALSKYDQNGTLIWKKEFILSGNLGTLNAHVGEVEIDSNDNLYACGSISTGGYIYDAPHAKKYDPSGTVLWSGGTTDDIYSMHVGPNGNLFCYPLTAIAEYDSSDGSSVQAYSLQVSGGMGEFCFNSRNQIYLATVYGYILAKFKIGSYQYLWRKHEADLGLSGILAVAWSPT